MEALAASTKNCWHDWLGLMLPDSPGLDCEVTAAGCVLTPRGRWCIDQLERLDELLRKTQVPHDRRVRVDASQAIELDSALSRLARLDPRAANIVELHFFAGLGLERIAELLGVSDRTVNRDWRVARAWLQSELEG